MTKKTHLNILLAVPLIVFVTFGIITVAKADLSVLSAYPPPALDKSLAAYPPPTSVESLDSSSAYPPPMSEYSAPIQPKASEASQKALEYVAKRDKLPAEALSIVDDHPTEYPNLGRKFQVVTILDSRPQGQVYKLLVDLQNGQVYDDISTLTSAESQTQQSKYGNLQPSLYNKLQMRNESETVPVAIWLAPTSQRTLADIQETALLTLASKYPEAQTALSASGKPFDVNDPVLAEKIEADYLTILNTAMEARVTPLATELTKRGYTVTLCKGIPTITTNLPKSVIIELSSRSDVGIIYLIEAKPEPELDSAVPNTLAPIVWARGYNGSGVTIGILENGNIDPNNSFLNLTNTRVAGNGVVDHTTRVTSDAASFHDTYTGVANGASVISAGHNDTQADVVTALQWAFDQGARIVNISEGFEQDNNLNWLDRAFDYWARARFRLITKSAGNIGGSITSPGKGWNVLAVGAYDDINNTNWSDDLMWADSSYINPVSAHNDREKPEVVAVGVNVTAVGVGDVPVERSGTSHAAPQVGGLAALLINRNSSLGIWPEAMHAIIMASATHNIEGPSIIVRGQGDLKDGAGAINADFADQIAQIRGTASNTCYSSCWWGESISNTGFPIGTDLTRNFYISKKSLVRVAIAWWANADTPTNNYSLSRLDTDLDLRIKGPNGQYLSGVNSLSFDNNYEIIQFFAYETGQYKVVVRKVRANETSNYLGTAVLMIPMPYSVYLPLVVNNH